jgi:hypothetical protein
LINAADPKLDLLPDPEFLSRIRLATSKLLLFEKIQSISSSFEEKIQYLFFLIKINRLPVQTVNDPLIGGGNSYEASQIK